VPPSQTTGQILQSRNYQNAKRKHYNKARRSNSEQDWAKYQRLKSLSQKTTRQAHNKYLYDIISQKLKDNNKQFYSIPRAKNKMHQVYPH
jgi:hypothetical protein